MSFDIVETQLSGDVANAGTFTVGYPTGRDSGDYTGGINNLIESTSYGRLDDPEDVSFSFDAALITITNNTGQTLAQGTDIVVQLDRIGADDEFNEPSLANEGTMAFLSLVQINLGAPDVADANGYVESQDLTALGVFSVDVTAAAALLAAALLGVADNPRNVVAAWTGTAIMTVTGLMNTVLRWLKVLDQVLLWQAKKPSKKSPISQFLAMLPASQLVQAMSLDCQCSCRSSVRLSVSWKTVRLPQQAQSSKAIKPQPQPQPAMCAALLIQTPQPMGPNPSRSKLSCRNQAIRAARSTAVNPCFVTNNEALPNGGAFF